MAKILVIANSSRFLSGFKQEFLDGLSERGHEVVAVLPKSEEMLGCKTIEVNLDRRGTNPFADLKLYRRYKKIIKAERPDQVVTYTVKPNIYGGLAAKKCKVPYFATVTGLGTGFQKPILRCLLKMLYRPALKGASAVFFENAQNRQFFLEHKLAKEDKTVLLAGSGVNLEKFCPLPYPKETKARLLFVGRVMREKGIEEFLFAAKKCKEQGVDAEFHIAGGFEEEYKQKLDALCKEGVIVYQGFAEDIREHIAACHAVVLPSWHEGMSNALLEGAACARPLITTDIHGCKEAVAEGGGLLVQKKDAEDLYQKIVDFCSLPLEERMKMGQRARVHMEENFDKRKVNKTVIEKMEEIL